MILLVDDNPAHRLLVRRAVRKSGKDNPTVELGSLGEALRFLDSFAGETPNLIIADLNLGDGRGTHFIRSARAKWRELCPPILLLSTSRLEEDLKDAQEAGVSEYIVKEDDPELFFAQMGRELIRFLK